MAHPCAIDTSGMIVSHGNTVTQAIRAVIRKRVCPRRLAFAEGRGREDGSEPRSLGRWDHYEALNPADDLLERHVAIGGLTVFPQPGGYQAATQCSQDSVSIRPTCPGSWFYWVVGAATERPFKVKLSCQKWLERPVQTQAIANL